MERSFANPFHSHLLYRSRSFFHSRGVPCGPQIARLCKWNALRLCSGIFHESLTPGLLPARFQLAVQCHRGRRGEPVEPPDRARTPEPGTRAYREPASIRSLAVPRLHDVQGMARTDQVLDRSSRFPISCGDGYRNRKGKGALHPSLRLDDPAGVALRDHRGNDVPRWCDRLSIPQPIDDLPPIFHGECLKLVLDRGDLGVDSPRVCPLRPNRIR